MSFRLALIQSLVSISKEENIKKTFNFVKEAALNSASVVVLPECWNVPYNLDTFPVNAEVLSDSSSKTIQAMSQMAKQNKICLIGGSIPEREQNKIYNSSFIFNKQGELIAHHRKLHLYDLVIPGKIKFQESLVLTRGDNLTMFDSPYCRIGIGICYDLRFPEYASLLAQNGCHLLCYPAAFNMITGPSHWELLQRSRALDNQVYVCCASPARPTIEPSMEHKPFIPYGHSSVVDPWGTVLSTTEHHETIVYADLNVKNIQRIRTMIPLWKQKRTYLFNS